ncbi:hypothetical protein ACIBO2_09460 [Nonomuraea sp. NPDC050022]|uniref:hypothetical protein n=1 Tax=unclassified Nonomuraea TaxID=2593643 RepID=UPI0033C9E2E0
MGAVFSRASSFNGSLIDHRLPTFCRWSRLRFSWSRDFQRFGRVVWVSGGAVSPEATGGAGVIFEYRLAAVLLSRMLRGAHVPIGIQLPIQRVALQQRVAGHAFDDIVVGTDTAGQGPTIEIQVKKRLSVTGGNPEFVKVMSTAIEACRSHTEELKDGRLLLGLAAGDPVGDLEALAELTTMARAHPDTVSFGRLLSEGVTRASLRSRHDHVVTAVTTAAATGSRFEAEALTHQVLSALHVWPVQVGRDGRDWRAELDLIPNLASAAGLPADAVLGRLYDLAQEAGPRAGDLDQHMICAELLRRYGLDLTHAVGSSPETRTTTINITNSGSGTVFSTAGNQVFNDLRIGR